MKSGEVVPMETVIVL